MKPIPKTARSRGTLANPAGRFEQLVYEAIEEAYDPEEAVPETHFFRDPSQSIISYNDSPDLPFDASINPYRGCEHGCIYCYARPTHEYLGLSAGLDFESQIFVKDKAPELLRQALSAPRWRPQPIALSGVTDPYQPIERSLQLTRRCLEVLLDFRNPVSIVTKNQLVTRDLDLLSALHAHQAVSVSVSVTSLDPALKRLLEPRTSPPVRRLDTVRQLAAAGIPVAVLIAPVIPGLTDHELPAIVNAAAEAGAQHVSYLLLRLPHGVGELFAAWLEQHFPDRRERVLSRIREVRDGKLNDGRFHSRFRGHGVHADAIQQMFAVACRRAGLNQPRPALSTTAFRNPEDRQLRLF